MIFDWIMSIPYWVVWFFVPVSFWEGWRYELQRQVHYMNKEEERQLRRTIKGRLVRRRWPLSY